MPKFSTLASSIFLWLFLVDKSFGIADVATPKSWEYCIVGAGPAGIQMGYYFGQSDRDYVIFEKNFIPGSFFAKYPRHRKLISINKRHTGRSNREFNLRHDWNSLLTNDFSLLFTNYSKSYFPHADELLEYLKDFVDKFNLNIHYGMNVSNLKYTKRNSQSTCRFTINLNKESTVCCRNVITATGLHRPIRLHSVGENHFEYYDSVSIDPDDFTGQSVMIIGRGNSGMEMAASIYSYTSYVHMLGRSRIRFSWDTHYVGDIRAVNNEIVDAYMLKSLDGFVEIDINAMKVGRNPDDGKLHFLLNKYEFIENSPFRHGYDRIIACTGFQWDSSILNDTIEVRTMHRKFPEIGNDYESLVYPGLYFIGALTHSLDFQKSAGGFIHGFRYTTRALNRMLEWANHDKAWPSLKRSLDQLINTLLNRANEASGIYQMFGYLADIAVIDILKNTFVYLEEFPINLLHSLSSYTGHDFDSHRHSLLVLLMEYGKEFSDASYDRFQVNRAATHPNVANLSNFLHPVIYFYKNRLPSIEDFLAKSTRDTLPKADGVHHVVEDFTTTFDTATVHRAPLRHFVEKMLDKNFRSYTADTCVAKALITSKQTFLGCQRYLQSYR